MAAAAAPSVTLPLSQGGPAAAKPLAEDVEQNPESAKPTATATPSERSRSSAVRRQVTLGKHKMILEQSNYMGQSRLKVHGYLVDARIQIAIAFVILLNCIIVGIEVQSGKPLGAGGTFFEVLEVLFLFVYIVELSARFFAYAMNALYDNWVKFDAVVVGSGIVELCILMPADAHVDGLGVLVVLRVMRLFRLARSLKMLMQFKEMAMLLKGLTSCMGVVFYTLILLVVMLFIFACAGKELVGSLADDETVDPAVAELVARHFPNITVSMLTLVQFVCLDSIASIYEPIIKERPDTAFYFMATTLVVGIVLMNLFTAVMVNTAIEAAEADRLILRQREKEKQDRWAKAATQLFMILDDDNSGGISREEFLEEGCPEKDKYFQLLREWLPEMELEEIFDSVDTDGGGLMDRDEFVQGVVNLVKSGSSPQMNRMAKQVEVVYKAVGLLAENQQRLVAHLRLPPLRPAAAGAQYSDADIRRAAASAAKTRPWVSAAERAHHDWAQLRESMDGMMLELELSLAAAVAKPPELMSAPPAPHGGPPCLGGEVVVESGEASKMSIEKPKGLHRHLQQRDAGPPQQTLTDACDRELPVNAERGAIADTPQERVQPSEGARCQMELPGALSG